MIYKICIFELLFNIFFALSIQAQRTITFPTRDGLNVTADFYEAGKDAPCMLLFHQANYSRGEYKETAQRFVKLGFNCLAVDLRNGNEINFVHNQTALLAKTKNIPSSYLNALTDIEAAIEYVRKGTKADIILVGSSYSASLSLLEAKDNKNVTAVIAFSPGEYFETENYIRNHIAGLSKPVFATSTFDESPFMIELLSKVDKKKVTTFRPSKNNGKHGSSSLWKTTPGSEELWLSLMMFVEGIK
jgi:hypothetical protein